MPDGNGAEERLDRVSAALDELDVYLDARCRPLGWVKPGEMLNYIAARLDEIRKLGAG